MYFFAKNPSKLIGTPNITECTGLSRLFQTVISLILVDTVYNYLRLVGNDVSDQYYQID